MKVYSEISLKDFEAWSGGEDTLDTLTDHEAAELEAILEEEYPDGIDETELNDILRFERDWIAELLGFNDWEDLEADHSDEDDE